MDYKKWFKKNKQILVQSYQRSYFEDHMSLDEVYQAFKDRMMDEEHKNTLYCKEVSCSHPYGGLFSEGMNAGGKPNRWKKFKFCPDCGKEIGR